MMSSLNIRFFRPIPGEQSTREKELEDAESKSYAAKISHQRRKQERITPQRRKLGQHPQHHPESAANLTLDLLHGNSDPFDALSITITPERNHLVSYIRDVVRPAIHVSHYFRRLSLNASQSPTPTLKQSRKILGGSSLFFTMRLFSEMQEGPALAWLSSYIPMIVRASCSPATRKLSVESLEMRMRSLKLMRQAVSKQDKRACESTNAVRLHARELFETECIFGQTDSARVHAAILMQLRDPPTEYMARAYETMKMMFNATELACMHLERTVIPFGPWSEGRLATFWELATPQLPDLSGDHGVIPPCARFPVFRTALTRIRYILGFGENPLPLESEAEQDRGDVIYLWIVTTTFHDMGMLVNAYVDLIEEKNSSHSDARRLTEACMTLVLLHLLRKSVHEADVDGIDVRDVSHVLIPRLKRDLTRAMGMLNRSQRSYYKAAYLWMFYAGAQAEQNHRAKSQKRKLQDSNGDHSDLWFSRALAEYAHQSNVKTWAAARSILETFIYNKHLHPNGEQWFEQNLTTFVSGNS